MHFVNEPWLVTAVLLLIVVPLTWKLGNWKGKTDADVGALKENVDRLILRMDNFIETFSGRAKGVVAGSQSPVSLNAYGKKLAKKIDAAEIVDAFAVRADAETKGMNDEKLIKTLNGCGKQTFVMFFYALLDYSNGDMDADICISLVMKGGRKKRAGTIMSMNFAKQIFRENRQCKALQICSTARIPNEAKQKANDLYAQFCA